MKMPHESLSASIVMNSAFAFQRFAVRLMGQSPRASLASGESIVRHLHMTPYATVILDGGYEEAGETGRWRVSAGDVIIHGALAAHRNLAPRGARVLNLPLPQTERWSRCGSIGDPDLIARTAEHDTAEATAALMQSWRPTHTPLADLPDLLATTLAEPNGAGIDAWSKSHGVSRQTAFRAFRAAYGVCPCRFRLEARARRAWRMIVDTTASLADISVSIGFADQAHMQRAVKALTGGTPGAWRRLPITQHSFNTPRLVKHQHW